MVNTEFTNVIVVVSVSNKIATLRDISLFMCFHDYLLALRSTKHSFANRPALSPTGRFRELVGRVRSFSIQSSPLNSSIYHICYHLLCAHPLDRKALGVTSGSTNRL
uniref:Uncharacterized protein n=1 Tax=Timema poppense TaxID=170557 RepID=A0A7R9DPB2_TIMPO|nr:unnamed protein product [Timema poppensis]